MTAPVRVPTGVGALIGDGDRRLLAWVGRFRFVTAGLVAERFGVTVQMARRWVARLVAIGLLGRERAGRTDEYAVYLTAPGARVLGLPRRRPPRVTVHREHELAIVWLASRIERATARRVLSERECRYLEAADAGRFSVEVGRATGRGDRRRWPDLVLEDPGRRVAVEIEFAPKGSVRLGAIVDGYLHSTGLTEVRFLVSEPATAGRLAGIVAAETVAATTRALFPIQPPRVAVSPWTDATAVEQAAVQRAIDAVERDHGLLPISDRRNSPGA